MQITEEFRDQILTAMPELKAEDARQIAALEKCSETTVYNHLKRLKNLEGEVSTIMLAIAEVAARHHIKQKKKVARITRQLSAA